MITGINELKTLPKHYHANLNINLMVENVIQIKNGIMINVNVSVKTNAWHKDFIWNPTTCSSQNGKYIANTMDDSVIKYDEIMESCDKETKKFLTNFIEEKVSCKTQNFTCIFINYYSIIDSCYYFLLSDKISSKTKTLATISCHK